MFYYNLFFGICLVNCIAVPESELIYQDKKVEQVWAGTGFRYFVRPESKSTCQSHDYEQQQLIINLFSVEAEGNLWQTFTVARKQLVTPSPPICWERDGGRSDGMHAATHTENFRESMEGAEVIERCVIRNRFCNIHTIQIGRVF